MSQITRESALALLQEYTKNESLIRHALSVEAAMIWYAKYFALPDNEILKWGVTGLIHDFDYEKHPSSDPNEGHPFIGNKILSELGYPEEIKEAIMGHATYSGVARSSRMAKTLFAVDELSGLITASVYVRPDRSIHTLEPKSVVKKMKDKAFARGCNRDDIKLGSEELGVELQEHIANVILALREKANQLGLDGKS
jgi:predicted hydrolase (HD superfamily)